MPRDLSPSFYFSVTARWCNGQGVGLAIERLPVRLLAVLLSRNNPGGKLFTRKHKAAEFGTGQTTVKVCGRKVNEDIYSLLLHKPCKRFASVARVCQRQLAFLVISQ